MWQRLRHYSESGSENDFDEVPLGPQTKAAGDAKKNTAQSTTADLLQFDGHASDPPPVNSTTQQGSGEAGHVESDPEHLTPVIDFTEVDGAQAGARELFLYAIPLFAPQEGQQPVEGLCFLPITNFMDEPDYTGMEGAIQERIDKLQASAQGKWQELKEQEQGTFGNKFYKVGHQVVNDLSAEERMSQSIPKNINKVIIYHPTHIQPDVIMEHLTRTTKNFGVMSTIKAAAAGLMIPIAFGIDIIVIPGPQVLTYYASFQLYKNASAALGSRRLATYVAQEGSAGAVRVNYAGEARLDHYFEVVQHCVDGVLEEDDVEAMVKQLGEHQLLEPLLELRQRRLKEAETRTKSGQKYTALSSRG